VSLSGKEDLERDFVSSESSGREEDEYGASAPELCLDCSEPGCFDSRKEDSIEAVGG